jgi:hypothetical protein
MKFITLLFLTTMICLGQENPYQSNNCVIEKSEKQNLKTMKTDQKNVLGTDLVLASTDPLTGYFRTGFCETDSHDRGVHVVAAVVTDAFLKYSLSKGNDLISS